MTMVVKAELNQLLNLVQRNKGQPESMAVGDDARLREDLGLDSLDLAELTVRIEERFGVDVFDEGVVLRWGDVCDRVRRHVERGSSETMKL